MGPQQDPGDVQVFHLLEIDCKRPPATLLGKAPVACRAPAATACSYRQSRSTSREGNRLHILVEGEPLERFSLIFLSIRGADLNLSVNNLGALIKLAAFTNFI